MKALRTSETSANLYETTQLTIPEDSHLHTRHCENLNSHGFLLAVLHNSGRLYDVGTGVRSPVEEKGFSSSLCVQTSSEAHSASYSMRTGGYFPGVMCGLGVTLTDHPEVKNE
jgi:hypothetical protein